MIGRLALHLAFAPLLPPWLLGGLAAIALVPLGLALVRRAPGALWRAAACAVLLLWLAGPAAVIRTGTRLPDIALMVVDHSASMQVADRAALAETEASRLADQAKRNPDLLLRRVDLPEAGTDGTRLFGAIASSLADVPQAQRAGVIALTDGAIADAPARFSLKLHALIPAAGEQTDRRLRITQAPGWGIVGQSVQIGLAVDDLGPTPSGATAHLRWSQDGADLGEQDVVTGQPATIAVPITRAGPTTIALAVDPLPGEASLLNNRVALSINGVRDRLRVLLISGQPHEGERTWRRLLKADPAVDLVHFTILRLPGKEDLTPLNQLALIAFPTHELFVEKIRQFDLIILDRFSNPGLLPTSYLQNIADYVRQGGALLVSAGPEFADTSQGASIASSPIGEVLPATPLEGADAVVSGAFRPTVTALGERHPVTAGLAGDVPGGEPHWGEWYRRIATDSAPGGTAQIVLQAGANGPPLLLLDHVGEGRVALLLSDQIWLWSRGHQGGGPQAELLRRVAHWLMQEPELDETALTATIADGVLSVDHRGLAPPDPAAHAEVTHPDGGQSDLLLHISSGGDSGTMPATSPGLWQVQLGEQHAYAAAEPADPVEYADLRATATRLRSPASSVHWLARSMPDLADLSLTRNQALRLTGVDTRPLLPAWLVLPLALVALAAGWWREGR